MIKVAYYFLAGQDDAMQDYRSLSHYRDIIKYVTLPGHSLKISMIDLRRAKVYLFND